MRGRFAIVTERWRGLRWTLRRQAGLSPDENAAAYGEVVWSWRRDPGATSAVSPAGNGGKKGRSPGRARISRKTIARGKPGCLGCTCQTRVRSLLPIAHGAAGAVGARLSLRPLSREGQRNCKTQANPSRENESACLPRSGRKLRCRPGLVRNCAREPGPIRRGGNYSGEKVVDFISTTMPCGYGSRRSPGRHRDCGASPGRITCYKSSRRYPAKCSSAPCPSRCAAVRRRRTRASAS